MSIVSLLIATAFSASAVEANASYDPETNHATVLHNENQVIPVAGTTQLSQDEYKRTWASLTDNAGTAAEIQATCELFISSIYASRRDSDYNCTTFTVQSIRNEQVDSTIAYIESQNQYQREIADICDFKIISDSIEFENFSGVLTGNTCTAEIGVHYCYEMEGAFEDTFYLNCVYYLTLEKSTETGASSQQRQVCRMNKQTGLFMTHSMPTQPLWPLSVTMIFRQWKSPPTRITQLQPQQHTKQHHIARRRQ
ncbi:MAG: hypothetical protein ACLRR6_12485 [Oscillospiraceae bacterium]